jgi:hypothetical protein
MSDENNAIILALTAPFEHLGQVPIGGGGTSTFIEWTESKLRMDHAVGVDNWDWRVSDLQIIGDATSGYAICKGSMTVRFPDGTVTTKEQFGESQYGQGGGGMAVGNAAKGASSDALKKCASLFGVAFEQVAGRAGKSGARNGQAQASRPAFVRPPQGNGGTMPLDDDDDGPMCADCGEEINGGQFSDGREFTAQTAAGWGMKKHGRPLCGRDLGAANAAKKRAEEGLESLPF